MILKTISRLWGQKSMENYTVGNDLKAWSYTYAINPIITWTITNNTINTCASKSEQYKNAWAVHEKMYPVAEVQIRKLLECKIVNIFLPISFNIFLGAQKNRLIETVLLSIYNICFRWEIRKQ